MRPICPACASEAGKRSAAEATVVTLILVAINGLEALEERLCVKHLTLHVNVLAIVTATLKEDKQLEEEA